MSEYPRMLYRLGGPVELQDGDYDTLIVADREADDQARAEGWHETPAAAKAAAEKPTEDGHVPHFTVRGEPAEDAPPTRAELEQKARELGVKFDGRTGDKKLTAAIAAALKE